MENQLYDPLGFFDTHVCIYHAFETLSRTTGTRYIGERWVANLWIACT
jgi:hypothetical protein